MPVCVQPCTGRRKGLGIEEHRVGQYGLAAIGLTQSLDEPLVIVIIVKDRPPLHPANGHMIDCFFVLNSQFHGHDI